MLALKHKSDLGIYQYKRNSSTYIFGLAKFLSDKNFSVILENGINPSFVMNRENDLESCNTLDSSKVCLSTELSVDGLKRSTAEINEKNYTNENDGDHILLHLVDERELFKDGSVYADLMEWALCQGVKDRLIVFAKVRPKFDVEKSKIKVLNREDLYLSRIDNEALVEKTGSVEVNLLMGTFRLDSFYSHLDRCYHWAFCCGDSYSGLGKKAPMVRIESECLTGHALGSLLCDCGEQLNKGLAEIQKSGCGILLYLRQEGRGIGLLSKIRAYRLQQEQAMDTVDANLALGLPEDTRDYGVGVQILRQLGVSEVKMITNNPAKIEGVEKYGIKVSERVPHIIEPTSYSERYLRTKKDRMGHML